MRFVTSLGLGVLTLSSLMSCAGAQNPMPAPDFTLESTVHFPAADGREISVPPGKYQLAAADVSHLRLTPIASVRELAEPAVVEAVPGDLGEAIPESVALSIPWQDDEYHLILLFPTGKGLEAIGSTTGIRSRGTTPIPLSQTNLQIAYTAQMAQIGPGPPTLASPADQSLITGASVRFTWQPGSGSSGTTTYRVCVTLEGQTCQSQTAWHSPGTGQPRLKVTEYQRDLPAALFQGRRLTWTVEACSPHPLRAAGIVLPDLCRSATPRRLSWALPPPQLSSPSDRTQLLGPRPTLSIFADVPGADSYLFCISQPGVGCPTTSTSNNSTVVAQVDNYYRQWTPGQDLSKFTGQTVHWTAGACNQVFGCVYQQTVREVTFPPIMVPVYLRINSQYHLKDFKVVRGGGPGFPRIEEVSIPSLVAYSRERQSGIAPYYQAERLLQVPKRQNILQEPTIPAYYYVEYQAERAGRHPDYPEYRTKESYSFAPGVRYGPSYSIVRETIFLFNPDSHPHTRHELVLRGPDGRLYIHRPYCGLTPGIDLPELMDGCSAPILLETLQQRGYNAYTPAQLGQP